MDGESLQDEHREIISELGVLGVTLHTLEDRGAEVDGVAMRVPGDRLLQP